MKRTLFIFLAGFVFALLLSAAWTRFSPKLFHHLFYLNSYHEFESAEPAGRKDEADLLVFSYDRPLQLYAFLETVDKNVKGINELHVLYKTSDDRFDRGYDIVKNDFPNVIFHSQSREQSGDFQNYVISITEGSPSKYISYAVDDIIVTKPFDLTQCIEGLKNHHAYVFINRAGLNLY